MKVGDISVIPAEPGIGAFAYEDGLMGYVGKVLAWHLTHTLDHGGEPEVEVRAVSTGGVLFDRGDLYFKFVDGTLDCSDGSHFDCMEDAVDYAKSRAMRDKPP